MAILETIFSNSSSPLEELRVGHPGILCHVQTISSNPRITNLSMRQQQNLMLHEELVLPDPTIDRLKPVLMSLCLHYLTKEKKRLLAINSVGRFMVYAGRV